MDTSADKNTNIYWLDNKKRIAYVSTFWDEFAVENEGKNVISSKVIGKSIWEFIDSDTTKMWLDTLLRFSETTKKEIERPYRCDSPDLKRYMKMKVVVEGSNILRLEHTVLKTEKRINSIKIFHRSSSGIASENSFKVRCSVCGRIKDNEEWKEIENISDQKKQYTVIYSVCEHCRSMISSAA